MAYVDVLSWSPELVINWLKGVECNLNAAQIGQIAEYQFTGSHLLTRTETDIAEIVPDIRTESLHAILRGIRQLRHLFYKFDTETLQSITLGLASKARNSYQRQTRSDLSPNLLPLTTNATPLTSTVKNKFDFRKSEQIRKASSNQEINQSAQKKRVSIETLEDVSDIVDDIMYIVNWLEPMFLQENQPDFYRDFRSILLRVAVELTSTAQRDQFVEQPNDIIRKTSKFLADYCDWVVLSVDEPTLIEPCWLDVICLRKKNEEDDLGVLLRPLCPLGCLTIDGLVASSPAQRSGRISVGDEIIQIDYQTVVGWQHEIVERLLKTSKKEIILTLKKKPSNTPLNTPIVDMVSYSLPIKRILSHNSESTNSNNNSENPEIKPEHDISKDQEIQIEGEVEPILDYEGSVYKFPPTESRRDHKRRASISGSIPDALADTSVVLPVKLLSKTRATKSTEQASP